MGLFRRMQTAVKKLLLFIPEVKFCLSFWVSSQLGAHKPITYEQRKRLRVKITSICLVCHIAREHLVRAVARQRYFYIRRSKLCQREGRNEGVIGKRFIMRAQGLVYQAAVIIYTTYLVMMRGPYPFCNPLACIYFVITFLVKPYTESMQLLPMVFLHDTGYRA